MCLFKFERHQLYQGPIKVKSENFYTLEFCSNLYLGANELPVFVSHKAIFREHKI